MQVAGMMPRMAPIGRPGDIYSSSSSDITMCIHCMHNIQIIKDLETKLVTMQNALLVTLQQQRQQPQYQHQHNQPMFLKSTLHDEPETSLYRTSTIRSAAPSSPNRSSPITQYKQYQQPQKYNPPSPPPQQQHHHQQQQQHEYQVLPFYTPVKLPVAACPLVSGYEVRNANSIKYHQQQQQQKHQQYRNGSNCDHFNSIKTTNNEHKTSKSSPPSSPTTATTTTIIIPDDMDEKTNRSDSYLILKKRKLNETETEPKSPTNESKQPSSPSQDQHSSVRSDLLMKATTESVSTTLPTKENKEKENV